MSSRFLLSMCALTLSLSVAVAQDPARQWPMGDNGPAIDFFGFGGQIVLYAPGNLNRWIRVQFFKLEEVDVNGTVVAKAENFEAFTFTWASKGSANLFGAKALEFTILQPLLPVHVLAANGPGSFYGVTFQVSSFLFQQNFTTNFAGETVSGSAGQVKWQVEIDGWKFLNAANKLHYGVQLLSSDAANNTAYKRLDHVPGTLSTFALGFGPGELIVPTVAQADGLNVTIGTNVTYSAGQLAVEWIFPSFNKTLVYDPLTATSNLVIDATTTTSGAINEKSVSVMTLMAAVVVAMWAINKQH